MSLPRPIIRYSGLMLGLLLAVGVLLIVWQGGFQSVSYQLLGWQRDLHRSLTLAISELSQAPSMATWVSLLSISFAYGVFHAAGGVLRRVRIDLQDVQEKILQYLMLSGYFFGKCSALFG